MKILFYSHTGTVSGAENILLLALKHLDREKFTPVAVCPEGNLAKEIAKLDIPVQTVNELEARFTWRVDLVLRYLLSLFRTIKNLRRKIVSAMPDAVHANSVRAGLTATLATIGMKKPIFWHIQDEMKTHPFSTLIRLLVALSPQTKLIPVSKATLSSFQGRILRMFGTNVASRVVLNAVELEKFAFDPANRGKIREEFGLSDDEFLLGAVGQITPRKGQLELIKTFSTIRREIPNSTLLIVGAPMFNQDHEYLTLLKQTVAELELEHCVKFLGLRKDVPAIMQSMDTLVVNSKSEALVVVAIEAMACGTPVIATSVGGTEEIIEHRTNGLLVNFGDEKELADAILMLERQPGLRAEFSEKGKEIVTARLNAKRFINSLEDFFLEDAPQTNLKSKLLTAEQ